MSGQFMDVEWGRKLLTSQKSVHDCFGFIFKRVVKWAHEPGMPHVFCVALSFAGVVCA